MDPPPPPVRWLVSANLLFMAGGLLAYFTATSLQIATAIALVAALPGLSALRHRLAEGQARLWLDRAYSYAIGSWAIIAVLVVVPYVTIEEGIALWGRTGFVALTIIVPSVGMLMWSAAAFQGLAAWDDVRSARLYAVFHLGLVALAVYFVIQGDGEALRLNVQGEAIYGRDLRLAPAIAAVPGLLWSMAFWRLRDPQVK